VTSTFHDVVADGIPTVGKLALQLSELADGDVLFLDEVHALKPGVQLALLTALEDGKLTVQGGSRSAAQTLVLPAFTLVAATTAPGRLSAPLRDRFAVVGHLVPVSFADLQLVLSGHCERAGIDITGEACEIIARASRYTPRLAIRLVTSVRDYVVDLTGDLNSKIDGEAARQGLEYAEIDEYGLDARDRLVIETLCSEHFGGPVGLNPLAGQLGMEVQELTRDVLPYLVRSGLWRQSSRGQCATAASYVAVGLTVPPLVNGLLR
jgi:Holliday junction DNA helicase RuvB